MTRWINTDRSIIPEVAEMVGPLFPTGAAQAIAEFDNKEMIAGALFDDYNGQSIHTHIWIAKGRMASRVWWWAIHDYMFRQLGVVNTIATVKSTNKTSIKVSENLGYKLVATIPNYYPNGEDQLIYLGTEEMARHWPKLQEKAKQRVEEC
jgi:RimJ/RimL family protein N-acetyltransferase